MEWTSLKWIKLRILFISIGFIAFLGLILFRGYQLHISENTRVHNLASKQYLAALPVHPKRGAIYDRNEKVLAIDVQVDSIAVHPHLIKDVDDVAKKLSSVLEIQSSKVNSKIKSGKKFEWIARRVEADKSSAIKKLQLEGIAFVPEYRRFYPNKELAGNVLGAVGFDAKALGGIELAFDDFLKSTPGVLLAEKDAKGRLYSTAKSDEIYHDIYLTLDVNLQFIAEKYLWENAQKNNAKSGFAIVMDPKTGEILALANYPSFNPNSYWEYSHDKWKNHALVDSYEPGSTFKTIIAAAALDSGVATSKDLFFCEEGSYRVGKKLIHDHFPYRDLSLSDIIRVSSNIGITKVAQKVGRQPIYDTIVKMGFGEVTGLDFPGEAKGSLPPSRKWSAIEQSNIAFGQGIAVSGLQMAQVYSTFANNGLRMKPYLISKVSNSEGKVVFKNRPTEIAQVIKAYTAKNVTKMLQRVVDSKGTGRLASVAGYQVAGKTGTAQKVNPKTKTYAKGEYIGSFIGYAPAENSQFVIYVVYDSPRPNYYGGVVAAPVFKNIAQEALTYSGIPPHHVQLAKSSVGEADE